MESIYTLIKRAQKGDSDAKEQILDAVKKLNPDIFDVAFLEESKTSSHTTTGFEGL